MSRWASGWRRTVVIVAALIGVALTFSLGRWQLGRAQQKIALQAALSERERLPALDGRSLTGELNAEQRGALLDRSVTLRGQWLPERSVFLDNRPMQGKTGFYVLTPLRLVGSNAVVLVQRGWAPRNFAQREALPAVQTPAGEVQVSGRVAERAPAVYALGQEPGGAIRQNLDLDAFRVETGLSLAPLIVVQTGAASEGLQRDWPAPNAGVDKHYGYAFQWFGLCALIGLLFLWFQVVKPLLRSRRA